MPPLTEYKASVELIEEAFSPYLTRKAISVILDETPSENGTIDASHLFFSAKKAFRNMGDRGKEATDALAKKLVILPEFSILSAYDLKQQAYQTIETIQEVSRRVYDVIDGKAEVSPSFQKRATKVA